MVYDSQMISGMAGLWAHCAGIMTNLENLLVDQGVISVHMRSLMFLCLPKFYKLLKAFGKVGIISSQSDKKIRAKLTDHGFPGFLSAHRLSDNHAGESYRMCNQAGYLIQEWSGVRQEPCRVQQHHSS